MPKKQFDSVKKKKKKEKKKKDNEKIVTDFRQNQVTGEIELLDQSGRKIRETVRNPVKRTVMTSEVLQRVLDLAREEPRISKIAQRLNMSKNTLLKALERDEEFKKDFDRVRAIAAYDYEDKMEELAENTNTEDDVPVSKFKYQVYNRLAEIKNPERYSTKRQQGEGNSDGKPIQIFFNTGIDRTKTVKDIPIIKQDKKKIT